jgi:triosephosphate isomerase
MKKLFIVANWKSYKTTTEVQEWLNLMDASKEQLSGGGEKEIIVCPSYLHIPMMKTFLADKNLPLKLGTQDISPFEEGAHTGAVFAKQAADFVTHAIVGHSERRKQFHETDEDVLAKVKELVTNNITPVLCISDMTQLDYYLKGNTVLVENADKIIFVYEPPSAISGGGAFHAEGFDAADKNAAEISSKIGKKVITLYGGSVNPENAKTFFSLEHIDGGLMGQASLDAAKLMQIITSAN